MSQSCHGNPTSSIGWSILIATQTITVDLIMLLLHLPGEKAKKEVCGYTKKETQENIHFEVNSRGMCFHWYMQF